LTKEIFTFKEFLNKKDEIVEKQKEIIIKNLKGKEEICFIIVKNQKELIKGCNNINEKLETSCDKEYGLILNFKEIDYSFLILENLENVIFMEELELDGYIGDEIFINFSNCIFLKEAKILDIRNNNLSFYQCVFLKKLNLKRIILERLLVEDCIIKKIEIIKCDIDKIDFVWSEIENLEFKMNKIGKELTALNLNKVKNFKLEESKFLGEVNLSSVVGSKFSCFSINNSTVDSIYLECEKFKNISFENFKVKYFSKINIKNFKEDNYKVLKIFNYEILDIEKTIENIKSLLETPGAQDNMQLYLDLIYIQKKYETKLLWEKVKKDKEVKDLLNFTGIKLLEISTKYFTCWKRCLLSILLINICFALLFFLMKYDVNQWGKLFECLYFSVITFSTVGYGDISPGTNLLKLLSAFEGLLGIFFTSAFVICLTRKYVK